MIHGAVLAVHLDAFEFNLNRYMPLDWAQEVWSFAWMEVQLQEIYVSQKLMTPCSWDELAAALR